MLCISNISGVSAENTQATVSEETISFYEQWKNKYLIENPYTDEKQYYVQYSEESYDEAQEEVAVTFSEYSTGLLPDFIVKDKTTGKFVPASENYLESENDGNYYYNSCRTPWRMGMDYLYGKNDNALSFAKTINSFIVGSANGNPENIKAGYKPDGTAVEDYNDLCFTAPFLISASCAGDKQWHDSIRSDILNYGEDVYYGDTIKLLCLIADDGAWIVPDVAEWVAGDVNADGVFNIADSIALQKWLTCTGELLNPEAGDMNSDNMLNVFDLCLMRRILTGHIKE